MDRLLLRRVGKLWERSGSTALPPEP